MGISKMAGRLSALAVVLLVVAIGVVAVAVLLLLDEGLLGEEERVDTVIVTVQNYGDGAWVSGVSNQFDATSYSGAGGSYTVELHRPAGQQGDWVVAANVLKTTGDGSKVSLRITLEDGTVLKEGSTTAPYGMVQLSLNVDEPS
jgi:hypothetical protein